MRPKSRPQRPTTSEQFRINRRIRTPEVRVINQDGQQLGVMPTGEAIRIAEAGGLDLVEVSPKAVPPVCKIMDFGRFKYEKNKQAAESRRHQSQVTIKEMKFRPKTDEHDLDFKIKKINQFLTEGNKVKLVVQFRGREIVHPEMGQVVLQKVIDTITDQANIEQMPAMEGRRMIMLVGPKVGVVRSTRPTPLRPPIDELQDIGASVPVRPEPDLEEGGERGDAADTGSEAEGSDD